MVDTLFAFGTVGHWEWLVILIVSCIIYGIPIVLAVVFFRMMMRNRNENIRLRLEVGKLADELEKTRKQQESEGGESQDQSG